MSNRAAENVPTSAPMVLIADSRPATFPALPTCSSFSRTAYGETMPSSRRGRAMSTPTPTSDPRNRPPESSSNAVTDCPRNGPLTNGTTASSTAAMTTRLANPDIVGFRSASRPPIA